MKKDYIKGEDKEEVFNLIKKGMAFRFSNQEILGELSSRGYEFSERTLRRYKLEIHEDSGPTFWEKYANQVMGNILDDILSYEEMQKKCWEVFIGANNNNERLRALTCLRGISSDKIKILKNVPHYMQDRKIDYEAVRKTIEAGNEAIKTSDEAIKEA